MGGGESCPECPVCEQKQCPECPKCEEKVCPECPKCDNSWSMVDDIKRIPISGTPFTILKLDLTDIHSDNDRERANELIRDVSTSLVLFMSPDSDYTKSDKLSIIALQVPYKYKARYVYGERAAYEKLKKASEVLNNVLKEYENWYIVSMDQSFDGSYSSIISGGEIAKRYNNYQPLITEDDIPMIQTLLGPNTMVDDDGIFGLKKGIRVNNLDLKITALLWRDSDVPSEKLFLMPEQLTEKFCTSSDNYYGLIITIIVLILIGIWLYILFSGGDESIPRTNVSEKSVIIDE